MGTLKNPAMASAHGLRPGGLEIIDWSDPPLELKPRESFKDSDATDRCGAAERIKMCTWENDGSKPIHT
jgi:hypothetical protein